VPFLVKPISRVGVVCRHDSLIRTGVEQVSINQRRGHVGATTLFAPRDERVSDRAVFQRDVARSSRSNSIDWLDRRITAGDVNKITRDERGRCGYFGIWTKTPQFFACQRIVTANRFRSICDQFSSRLPFVDGWRSPGGNFFTRSFPNQFSVLQTVSRNKRVLLNIGLNDYQVTINDRRAAVFPLIIRIVEPTGVEHSDILFPEQLAVEVVGIKTMRPEKSDEIFSVRYGSRIGMGRFRMSLDLWQTFVGDALPKNLAG